MARQLCLLSAASGRGSPCRRPNRLFCFHAQRVTRCVGDELALVVPRAVKLRRNNRAAVAARAKPSDASCRGLHMSLTKYVSMDQKHQHNNNAKNQYHAVFNVYYPCFSAYSISSSWFVLVFVLALVVIRFLHFLFLFLLFLALSSSSYGTCCCFSSSCPSSYSYQMQPFA